MSSKTVCECGGYYSSAASKYSHIRTVKHTEWKAKKDRAAEPVAEVKKLKIRVVKPDELFPEEEFVSQAPDFIPSEAPKFIPSEAPKFIPSEAPKFVPAKYDKTIREFILEKSFGDNCVFEKNSRNSEHGLLKNLYSINPTAFTISELHTSPCDPRPRYSVKVFMSDSKTSKDYHIYTAGSGKRIGEICGVSCGYTYTLVKCYDKNKFQYNKCEIE